MRVLCVFAFHEDNWRVQRFIRRCVFQSPKVKFLFVANNQSLDRNEVGVPPYCDFLNRPNTGYDFGAWSYGLLHEQYYLRFTHFILANSSIVGPFGCAREEWPGRLLTKLSDEVKLVGPTINCIGDYERRATVQSYLFAVDRSTLEFLIDSKIFDLRTKAETFGEAISCYEIRMSRLIINNGWNIGCLHKMYDGIDFRKKGQRDARLFLKDQMHPLQCWRWTREEVMFVKGNRFGPYVADNSIFAFYSRKTGIKSV